MSAARANIGGSLPSARADTRPSARPSVVGVGVDVVDVARLGARLTENPRLAEGLFTPAERAAADRRPDRAAFLALCFAAKEALLKALRRGLVATGPDAALQEIELCAEEGRDPELALSGRIAAAVKRRRGAPTIALARAGGGSAGVALATVLLLPRTAPRRTRS